MPTRSPSPSALLRPLLLPLLVAAASGCAGRQHREYVFPPPPETARIKYVRTFQSSNDMDPGLGRRILNAILPHDPGSSIKTPTGIALSNGGKKLYVACGASGRVVEVDLESKEFSSAIPTDPASRPAVPYGVALDAGDRLYVTDRAGGAVFLYDAEGKFLQKFGADRLVSPTDIAIDREAQQLYVVSGATSVKSDHRIEVFSLAGQHVRTLGQRGGGEGAFNFPTALAVAPGGTLFVADMLNFRVQSFDREGRFLAAFGQIGVGMPGAFDKIRGLAFDSFGNIYVVDARQGVHILNENRQPLLLFGGPPFMTVPGPIAIAPGDRIFVADFGQDSVHEYELVNATTAPEPPEAAAPSGEAPAPAPTGGGPSGSP